MMQRDEWFESLSTEEKGALLQQKDREQSWDEFWDEKYNEYAYQERVDDSYRKHYAWHGFGHRGKTS